MQNLTKNEFMYILNHNDFKQFFEDFQCKHTNLQITDRQFLSSLTTKSCPIEEGAKCYNFIAYPKHYKYNPQSCRRCRYCGTVGGTSFCEKGMGRFMSWHFFVSQFQDLKTQILSNANL